MDQTVLTISSPGFANGDTIPEQYTCRGAHASPPLTISGAPEGTVCFALIMHDPDAPSGDFLHRSVWNIDADITDLRQGELPDNAVVGLNGFGKSGYGSPCPPSGTHRYYFEVYALDARLDLPAGSARQEVNAAIQDHSLAKASLMGTVRALT